MGFLEACRLESLGMLISLTPASSAYAGPRHGGAQYEGKAATEAVNGISFLQLIEWLARNGEHFGYLGSNATQLINRDVASCNLSNVEKHQYIQRIRTANGRTFEFDVKWYVVQGRCSRNQDSYQVAYAIRSLDENPQSLHRSTSMSICYSYVGRTPQPRSRITAEKQIRTVGYSDCASDAGFVAMMEQVAKMEQDEFNNMPLPSARQDNRAIENCLASTHNSYGWDKCGPLIQGK